MDTRERIRELEEQVRYHSDLYFNQSKSEITDAEFDALVDELRSLAPESAVLGEVGAVPSYGQKVKHSSIMGSLDKTKDASEVERWARTYTTDTSQIPKVTVMPKMDGVAVRLNYDNGRLVEAATRGNGEVGQAVTDNVRVMKAIPNTLSNNFTGEVRGEVHMPRSAFDIINQQLQAAGEKTFANPRNAASGSLTCQDPQVTANRKLDFVWYDVFCDEEFATEREKRLWGSVNLPGLKPVEMQTIELDRFPAVALEWEAKRASLDYDIDGLVISLVSIEDQQEAGWSGRCPKGKLAYKFKPEQKTSVVLDIDFQVGRTGRLTPVCRIEPTYIAGSTVSNLTLHNYGRVKELGVVVGDEILFEKAGDIIPAVIRVTQKKDPAFTLFLPPEICPSCGEPVSLDENEVNLWCKNPACPAKLEERVLHWIKRLDILGIGPAAVKALCSYGLVKDIADLYYLTPEKVAHCISGDTMPGRIVELILEKNEVPFWQFLSALGIHNLGRTTSKLVANEFKSLDNLRDTVCLGTKGYERLCLLDGIGETVATNIIDGLNHMWETIDRVTECIDVLEVKDATGPLAGLSFCMTGALPSGTKRDEMARRIEAAGGEVKSSVSKGLTYLVQADVNSTSSKSVKARKYGTEIIDETMLLQMMEG